MSEIIYRKLTKNDYETIKSIISEAFGFHKIIRDKNLLKKALNIYLHSCLMETTFNEVAEKDGEVIGIIFGNCKNSLKKTTYLVNSAIVIWNSLSIACCKSQYKSNLKEYRKILTVYDELMKNRKHRFQGSVALFAVRESCRGYGVGKHLMNSLLNYMKTQNANSIYVYTDTICNYGFYESQGFIRLDERTLEIQISTTESAPLNVFMYEYIIS